MTSAQTIGTKEWSDYSVNFQSGCRAGCEYCYAREMADKFGWKGWNDWGNPDLRYRDVGKSYRNKQGVAMFPTSHNIDRENLIYAKQVINRLLNSRSKILIVMKPEAQVVNHLCESYYHHHERIEFRFTITTGNPSIRLLFEPNAPSINERIKSVQIVHEWKMKVSISIEPFLDATPIPLIQELIKLGVKPSEIWLGPMNHLSELVKKSDVLKEYEAYLRKIYLPKNLRVIKDTCFLRGWEINYKDGFLNQMRKK